MSKGSRCEKETPTEVLATLVYSGLKDYASTDAVVGAIMALNDLATRSQESAMCDKWLYQAIVRAVDVPAAHFGALALADLLRVRLACRNDAGSITALALAAGAGVNATRIEFKCLILAPDLLGSHALVARGTRSVCEIKRLVRSLDSSREPDKAKSISPGKYADSLRATLRRGASALESTFQPFADAAWACRRAALQALMAVSPGDIDSTIIEALRGLAAHNKVAPLAAESRKKCFSLLESQLKPWLATPPVMVEWYLRHASALVLAGDGDDALATRQKGRNFLGKRWPLLHGLLFCGDFETKSSPLEALKEAARCFHAAIVDSKAHRYDAPTWRRAWAALSRAPAVLRQCKDSAVQIDATAEAILLALGGIVARCETRDNLEAQRADAQRADAYWLAAVLAAKRGAIAEAVARSEIAEEVSLPSRTLVGRAAVGIASLRHAEDVHGLRLVSKLLECAVALPKSGSAAWTALSDCFDRLGRVEDARAAAVEAACRCADMTEMKAAVGRYSHAIARVGTPPPSLLGALKQTAAPLTSVVLLERFRICQTGKSDLALVTAAEELASWDVACAPKVLSCASLILVQRGECQAGLALAQRSLTAASNHDCMSRALAHCAFALAGHNCHSARMLEDSNGAVEVHRDRTIQALEQISNIPQADLEPLVSVAVCLRSLFAGARNSLGELRTCATLVYLVPKIQYGAIAAAAAAIANIGFAPLARVAAFQLNEIMSAAAKDQGYDLRSIEARHYWLFLRGVLGDSDAPLSICINNGRALQRPRAASEACVAFFGACLRGGNDNRAGDATYEWAAAVQSRACQEQSVLLKDSAQTRADSKRRLWISLAELWLMRGFGSRARKYAQLALDCEPGKLSNETGLTFACLRIAIQACNWHRALTILVRISDAKCGIVPFYVHCVERVLYAGDLMRRQSNLDGAIAFYLDACEVLNLMNNGISKVMIGRFVENSPPSAVFSRPFRRVLRCAARIIDLRGDRENAVAAYRAALLSQPSNVLDGAVLRYRLGRQLLHRAVRDDKFSASAALGLLRCACITARRARHWKLAANSARVLVVAALIFSPGAVSSPLIALLVHTSLGRARLTTAACDEPTSTLSNVTADVDGLLDHLLASNFGCFCVRKHRKQSDLYPSVAFSGGPELDHLLAPLSEAHSIVAIVVSPTGHLIVNRMQRSRPPTTLCMLLPPGWYDLQSNQTVVGACQEILRASSAKLRANTKSENKPHKTPSSTVRSVDAARCRAWWRQRHILDDLLGAGLRNFEETWLGPMCALLATAYSSSYNATGVANDTERSFTSTELFKISNMASSSMDSADLGAFLRAETGGVVDSTRAVTATPWCEAGADWIAALHDKLTSVPTLKVSELKLALDKFGLSKVGLKKQLAYRLSKALRQAMKTAQTAQVQENVNLRIHENFTPSAAMRRQPLILALEQRLQCLPIEDLAALRTTPTSRVPSLAFALALAKRMRVRDQCNTTELPARVCCVVDPEVNLPTTRNKLEAYLDDIRHDTNLMWSHITTVGNASAGNVATQVAHHLPTCAVYLFCGHGHGATYLNSALESKSIMSALLLMGCSSGALSDEGNFEPRGIPVELLARGAPTVISMLWDITDRDIDRLTLSLLEHIAKRTTDPLPDLLNAARAKTKLRRLNGAAPVCYGLPVSLADIIHARRYAQ